MHLGRKYKLKEFLLWTKWETGGLFLWSLSVTAFLDISGWTFLETPAPVLAIIGTAVAIILGFKNQQCHARVNEALALWGQINSASHVWATKLVATVGELELAQPGALLKEMFYRHFAWLTAMRFFLREPKVWENLLEPGNRKFLAALPTPESRSSLKDELPAYLVPAEAQKVITYRGDKEALILRGQYESLTDLHRRKLITDHIFVMLTGALDEFFRLQGAVKRIKNYPYARNFYSISLLLLKAFIGIIPFGLFPYFQDLGRPFGGEYWTAWFCVPFSVFVGWVFMTLEKVGENSSNPFEGGPNDVPISFLARRIEIDMRLMLGEQTNLKPVEAKYGILF